MASTCKSEYLFVVSLGLDSDAERFLAGRLQMFKVQIQPARGLNPLFDVKRMCRQVAGQFTATPKYL